MRTKGETSDTLQLLYTMSESPDPSMPMMKRKNKDNLRNYALNFTYQSRQLSHMVHGRTAQKGPYLNLNGVCDEKCIPEQYHRNYGNSAVSGPAMCAPR